MFDYTPNMYHRMEATKSTVGESSHLWFLDRGDSRKYVVKMAKTASGSQDLVQEYHTNLLYKYVLDKGLGQVCAVTVPKVRLAGATELAELRPLIGEVGGQAVLIQEFRPGEMLDAFMVKSCIRDNAWTRSTLVENKGFLGSIGVLAGIDVAFYNTDRLGVAPIFSHNGNLGNILAHAQENGAPSELVAIDNVSKKLSQEGMVNMQRQLHQLTEMGVGTVGGDILNRMLATTGDLIGQHGGTSPVYDARQLSQAGKTLGLGFMQGLIWMRDFIGDEGFEQMREQVDGQASGGIIASTLSTLNAKGDRTVQHVMEAIAEPD